ncbi:MAG: HAMP domain-containing histidine kinase [Chitinophagaceae bacterium]|nr:HAMP domain-containing histidine kinase [Chitinophagaceae bacterium]
MKLRIRIALLLSSLVFVILLVSVTSIYILYEKFRKDEFYERVKTRAIFFGSQYLIGTSPSKITGKSQEFALFGEKVAFYNEGKQLIYVKPDTLGIEIPEIVFAKAKRKQFSFFNHGYRESVAYYVDGPLQKGYVISSAYDKFGRRKIENLQFVMLCTLGGGLLLSGIFSFFYVKQIVKPLSQLTNQMQLITESNMDERLVVTSDKSELNQIARNFNEMLDRLENAFEMRKRFVQQASHELRTPLANMLAQTEAALSKKLTAEESYDVLQSLKEDQQHIIELTNSLLLLSKYEKLALITDLSIIRVDETLYEAIDQIKIHYPDSHIQVNFTSVPENDGLLTVMGNEVLLMSALQNLVKNACHYSEDNEVMINIDAQKNGMRINFENNGKQLSDDEMQRLFIPFFRGENSVHKKGFGLGLSIVQRIVSLHKGTIRYTAVNERLNRFSLIFPKENA